MDQAWTRRPRRSRSRPSASIRGSPRGLVDLGFEGTRPGAGRGHPARHRRPRRRRLRRDRHRQDAGVRRADSASGCSPSSRTTATRRAKRSRGRSSWRRRASWRCRSRTRWSGLTYHTPVTTAPVFGGVEMGPQERALKAGVDIIVATPGRLMDHMRHDGVDLLRVQVLVLDEADRMMDMGFWPDVQKHHVGAAAGSADAALLGDAAGRDPADGHRDAARAAVGAGGPARRGHDDHAT